MMRSRFPRTTLSVWRILLIGCVAAQSGRAADVADWIKALGSDNEQERATAIVELKKLGESSREALVKTEKSEGLKPRQLVLIRRLIGDMQIVQTPLKPVDLSKLTPFGEDKEKEIKGDENLLLNRDTKTIVMKGEFVLEQGPLEYLICSKGENARLHETVAAVYARPRDISYALLACAYTFAGELGSDGAVNLPKEAGVMISIEYEWEPANAKMDAPTENHATPPPPTGEKISVRVPIEFFVWNSQTEKTMKLTPFAFTGSAFEKDPDTGKKLFMADIEKSIVAVKLDPYALMNSILDTRDIDPQHNAGYAIDRYTIPPRLTKCRVIFEPWAGTLTEEDLKDTAQHNEIGGVPPAEVQPGEVPPRR